MKKILFLAVMAVMAVSCFKGTYYESSFATVSNFEFADAAKYFTDSIFVNSDFQSGTYLLIVFPTFCFPAAKRGYVYAVW